MKKYLIAFFLLGTAFMIYMMMKTGSALKTDGTPKGIFCLEFAYDKIHTDNVLTAWSVDNKIEAGKTNTMWDFCFLFFYSGFLFLTCKALSEKFNIGTWKYKAGRSFAKAAIIAGLLDIGENLGMLQTLNGKGSNMVALITTICASLKWLLVILILIYVLLALASKRTRV